MDSVPESLDDALAATGVRPSEERHDAIIDAVRGRTPSAELDEDPDA